MNWTVYWFMLPVCITVASVAMFSGIGGAALLTPIFLIVSSLYEVYWRHTCSDYAFGASRHFMQQVLLYS